MYALDNTEARPLTFEHSFITFKLNNLFQLSNNFYLNMTSSLVRKGCITGI